MPSAAIVSNNKRIAKNTIILYLRLIIVLFLTLYISRLVLDVLGVNDFGIYNVVSGFVAMFAFLNASMSNGVQRFFNVDIGANNGSNISEIYTISLYIQFMLAGLLFVIAECVGIWYINNVMVIPSERLFAANWVFQFSVFSFLFFNSFFRFFLIFCEIFTQTLSVKRIIGQYTSDKSLPSVNRQITKPRNEPTVTNTLKNPSIYATEKINRLSDTIKT